MTELEDLARTPALVQTFCDALDRRVSEAFRADAHDLAKRAELHHPINRSPSTVAAAAIYLTSIRGYGGFTQGEVADAGGVSEVAIRNCYPEIAEAEGLTLSRSQGRSARVEAER